MRLKSDMPDTLKDLICQHGAPNSLFSDNAKVQYGKHILNLLHLCGIKVFQSEPYHQHQNFAERKTKDTKNLIDAIIGHTGMAVACLWLICLLFVAFLLKHLAWMLLVGLPIEIFDWSET
jgi:hypothetical protein